MFRLNARRTLVAALAVAAALLLPAGGVFAQGQKLEVAVFAGGCFWCIESDFDKVPGVVETVSGYAGGKAETATYNQVGAGGTGHLEAVRITYDANKITYEKMLHLFWRSIDPTDAGGQFCDRGASYATAVFAANEEQNKLALASKQALVNAKTLKAPVVTPVLVGAEFYPAETYHQDYHTKNPYRYKFYRLSCGRDRRVKQLWGDDAWGGQGHS